VEGFAATLNPTVPLPEPFGFPETVIQPTLEVADQLQPEFEVTATLVPPPA
jgi:hypothetical protein